MPESILDLLNIIKRSLPQFLSIKHNSFVLFFASGNLYFCSFENEDNIFCGARGSTAETFTTGAPDITTWTRLKLDTPTYGTGPGKARSGDWYIYLEASDVKEGTEAK